MPPHCDSWDGPVVKAALLALGERSAELVLPYVPAEAESEIRRAYERTVAGMSTVSPEDLAVQWFCETVVRLHRAGEGADFTGIKPAGLDRGPAIPLAERALADGDPGEVAGFLCDTLQDQVRRRFDRVRELETRRTESLETAREYVEAMLGFQVWAHRTYQCMSATQAHDHGHPRTR